MKKVRIGVFGGHRGYAMIKQLLHSEEAELVAVCDKYAPLLERVKKSAAETGANVALFENFEDFIQYDMDAVVLANYATEHSIYAVRCLNAGKHVLSEVLPAETPAQAVELIETVERTGLVYAYAENYCYMKAPFEMWRRYQKGDIGKLQYAEAEYIHDCAASWGKLTYGERDHWRNHLYPTFYCTHSIGPVLTSTGLRPKTVVGFEPPLNDNPKNYAVGFARSPGIEMITLSNGAILKSVHGPLKKEPHGVNYRLFGTEGSLETEPYSSSKLVGYIEGETLGNGENFAYEPENEIGGPAASEIKSHGGSDFYPTYFFVQKILGKEEGKWSIDIYKAVDMWLCGVLAYRSILAGNKVMEVPDFRNKAEREPYRNDNLCTNEKLCGKNVLPTSSHPVPYFEDEVYNVVREKWLAEETAKAADVNKDIAKEKTEK